MGWSLKGILQGAAEGAADWAVRGQQADLQAARDAAQFERSKELARYNDEIGGARTASTLKLKQEMEDKAALREAESIAENSTLAGEYAAEKGAKPGSKEWHVRKAEFLNDSGRTAMAKDENTLAEKYDDNEIKREQNRATLAAAAARRSEGGGAKGGDGEFDLAKSLERTSKYGISGVLSDKGELKIDPNSPAVAMRAYQYALTDPAIVKGYPDMKERQRVAAGVADNLVIRASELAQKNGKDLLAGFNLAISPPPEKPKADAPAETIKPAKVKDTRHWSDSKYNPNPTNEEGTPNVIGGIINRTANMFIDSAQKARSQ